MRTWEDFLIDKPFYLNTDHRIIESLLQQQTCSQRLARWLNKLALFQPRFKRIAGSTNTITDCVSRRPDWADGISRAISLSGLLRQLTQQDTEEEPAALFTQFSSRLIDILDSCRKGYADDRVFGPIMQDLTADQDTGLQRLRRFCIDDDLLFFQIRPDAPQRLCILDVDELRNLILFEEHDSSARGHLGSLLEKYYWRGMAESVQRYVSSCELCQGYKCVRGKPAGLLYPLEIPANRWTDISMDFMTLLPCYRSCRSPHQAWSFCSDSNGWISSRYDSAFRDFYQRLHGTCIVSDRDTKVTSRLWQEIVKLQETQLQLSSAFRPSTDGQSEVTIKFVYEYIRHFIVPLHDDWDVLLPLCELRTTHRVNSTTGMSPFMADLGFQPRSVSDCVVSTSRQSLTSTFVNHQKAILAEAQDVMAAAQERWHAGYDRNRSHLSFTVGDQVLLSVKNLDLVHLGMDDKRKFVPWFIGPYKITDITGPDTYKLALPPVLHLHPDYHVSRLRPYQHDDDPTRITRARPVLTMDGTEGHHMHSIVRHRRFKGARQFKVKWLDTSLGLSWESLANLTQVTELIRQCLDTLPAIRATALLREEV